MTNYTAGIPTIIKPFFGDQFFWADRVEALGIGTGVRKLTVTTLSEALVAATTDQKQIHRAKVVGESIRAVSLFPDCSLSYINSGMQENGVATAIEAIYRDLEYARSLIKGIVAKDESRSDRFDDERDTIREQGLSASTSRSRRLSGESSRGATSDWSVISDQEDSPVTP